MFKSSILKLPILLLARNKIYFQQAIKRKLTITPPLLKEKKEQNNSNLGKKIESKRKTFQEAKKRKFIISFYVSVEWDLMIFRNSWNM